MGSNPVFPNLFSHAFTNSLNIVNINLKAKKLSFILPYARKTSLILYFLKSENIINNYRLIKTFNNKINFLINLNYYKTMSIIQKFKLFSKKTQIFFISLRALRLLDKRAGSSLFLLSTTKGLISHKTALLKKTSGFLIGSFFN